MTDEQNCPKCGSEMVTVRLFAQEWRECGRSVLNTLLGVKGCATNALQAPKRRNDEEQPDGE